MDSCCTQGAIHIGTPTGIETEVHGVKTYKASAPNFNGRAVLFIHDALGWGFNNNRLLADTYAKQANVDVYLPDFYFGDPVPEWVLTKGFAEFDIKGWLAKHPKSERFPLIKGVATELREKHGVTKLAAIGFCWGGWGTLMLGATDLVDAVCVAHPSLVELPTDIENLKKPCLFLMAEVDNQMGPEKQEQAKEILKNRPEEHKFVFYPGTSHGFAVRTKQIEDDIPAKAAQDAKNQAVDWFNKYL
jgi:dienelactone hydrolase